MEGRKAKNYVPPLFFEKAGDNKHVLSIMVFNPSAGADEALGPFSFFRIINNLSICEFPAGFNSPSNGILTVFPIQLHRQPMLTLP